MFVSGLFFFGVFVFACFVVCLCLCVIGCVMLYGLFLCELLNVRMCSMCLCVLFVV